MRIALFQPEIAGNVGTILRTAACIGLAVDLIEPLGFPFGDRAMKRAGMDYLAGVDVVRHADWEAFRRDTPGRLMLLSTRGSIRLPDVRFEPSDVLLFGAESAGVPAFVHASAGSSVRIPLRREARSLNLAVAAGIALSEALRQLDAWPT